jgi:hypothetical protein
VRKGDDPNSVRHIEIINDERKALHEIMPGAVFARGPALGCASDFCLALLGQHARSRGPIPIVSFHRTLPNQPTHVPPLPR